MKEIKVGEYYITGLGAVGEVIQISPRVPYPVIISFGKGYDVTMTKEGRLWTNKKSKDDLVRRITPEDDPEYFIWKK